MQLGMPQGTASHRLRKMILFQLLQVTGLDTCYQCKKTIKTVEELSIDHKVPWLDSKNPRELFFDLDNIAFSHLKCNQLASRRTKKRIHPSTYAYRMGCRCSKCKEMHTEKQRKYR